ASISAVSPDSFCALTFAPLSIRNLTASMEPTAAAYISGVLPPSSLALASAALRTIARRPARLFVRMASYSLLGLVWAVINDDHAKTRNPRETHKPRYLIAVLLRMQVERTLASSRQRVEINSSQISSQTADHV